jgi:hypothetical protein
LLPVLRRGLSEPLHHHRRGERALELAELPRFREEGRYVRGARALLRQQSLEAPPEALGAATAPVLPQVVCMDHHNQEHVEEEQAADDGDRHGPEPRLLPHVRDGQQAKQRHRADRISLEWAEWPIESRRPEVDHV